MRAWQAFLETLRRDLGEEVIEKWLLPLQVVHFDACNLYLEAQDSFQLSWFEEHIRPRLKRHFRNNNNHPIKVHLTLSEHSSLEFEDALALKAKPPDTVKSLKLGFQSDALLPEANLANFIPGSANEMLFKFISSLTGMVEDPAIGPGTFNPIYIYGDAVTGKTHILMGIGHAFKEQGLRVIYCRAETFTEHVVLAIRSGVMQEFRKAYRHADVLIIDDIQILARRGATQEELFHTFNALHTAGKQIIISANCPPQLLQAIEPRLISRFEWGITLLLEKLNTSEMGRLLQKKLEESDLHVNEEVIRYLIKTFGGNPRSIIRAVEALLLRTHMRNIRSTWLLDVDTIADMLKDLGEEEKKESLDPQAIINAVAQFYGLPPGEILGKSQAQNCVLPRQVAMHLCRLELKLPYLRLGELFHRNHSTVMSSIKLIQKKLESQDRELASTLSVIRQKFNNV